MILDDGVDEGIPESDMLDFQFDVSEGSRGSEDIEQGEDEGWCLGILGYSAEEFEREVGGAERDWEGFAQHEDTEPTLVDDDEYLELAMW